MFVVLILLVLLTATTTILVSTPIFFGNTLISMRAFMQKVEGAYPVTLKGKAAGELRLKMSTVRCAYIENEF
jgi:hypothetical protein